ncbi:bifunctional phosphoribosylaminoimidazolecarboxamide formyltransferase/IMP cyclohydrolase [Flavihumibacter fluvii]|uniref:bifunctional phosphoribosylaminoimidazolecarboxamide formyltransferase/IMP cyclohydrolase n=1 Tax=Flavihumibacter fluvii TaxID=2838157 RepID=UPI001BDDDBC2|nr:bifunctional phosphoribosylaminoimidazolecarboxamide formyltransferase/IMP cyclohydrolase [Flavihumibacter fluvii]ULQ51240.1 bifunctional phosphoribosylaminoimidazolecarboxamide formyltransferase/IMP cyclohydrolase [Flavihumibacter fluvii]
MTKKIQSALISVFYKDGLEPLVRLLHEQGVTIYSTGGTQQFIEKLNLPCVPVENVTTYPSILGGRVKTLHPKIFGGILGRRNNEQDVKEMKDYEIPELDLVIVDLYPFEETVANTTDEQSIIEKIDIGGPSMIRGAAKNHRDVVVIASKQDYSFLEQLLREQKGTTTLEQRRHFAARAFEVCAHYDVAISQYFTPGLDNYFLASVPDPKTMRYGENPHQKGVFYGALNDIFNQLNGKELSYNNLVDVDAAVQLIREFQLSADVEQNYTFAIIKHTNVCGIAARPTVKAAWDLALAGDPESAFGGVLVCNGIIDSGTANAINEIFFEVLIAPDFEPAALDILRTKKNRILLQQKKQLSATYQFKSLLNGVLMQENDEGNFAKWEEAGGRPSTSEENEDLLFANLICKHLKSNAIALVKNKQLIGKGCGQTSRIDSLRQAIDKSKQFKFDLKGAVLASDAFFPFNDCVQLAHEAGIEAFVQPGGSIRDKDSIEYCKTHHLALVMTDMRHFKH